MTKSPLGAMEWRLVCCRRPSEAKYAGAPQLVNTNRKTFSTIRRSMRLSEIVSCWLDKKTIAAILVVADYQTLSMIRSMFPTTQLVVKVKTSTHKRVFCNNILNDPKIT